MILGDRKRCRDASHSESTSCEDSGTLICFAKLWECVRFLASLLSASQISNQTGERDVFNQRVRRAR